MAPVSPKKPTRTNGNPGPGELLQLIRASGAITRAELSARTGLGRSTVAQRVEALRSHGLLVETDGAPSTGGRPPLQLTFNPDAGLVLAADLGATHARLALTDLSGRSLAEEAAELAIADGPELALETVVATFERLLASAERSPDEPRAIGLGLPGPVEHATGRPVSPPIMPGWDDYPVPERLRERFPVPILVDNDVNIMALGEASTRWPEINDLLFVKVGTGIGCGIIVNGEIHRGFQGAAGDIGHIQLCGQDDVGCECGNRGCLEAVASGRALARAAREQGREAADGRDVVALVRAREPKVVRLVRDAGRHLGEVLSGFVNGLNPAVIVIGGDVAAADEQLFAGVREIVYQRSTALATRRLAIVPSALGNRAGVVGAARMAADHLLDPQVLNQVLEPAGSLSG